MYKEFSVAVHGGFAFLLVNGFGWLAWGILAHWWPPRRMNLLLLIQGAWSFPAALALQNAIASAHTGPEPPLELLLLLALTQTVAIPASLIAFFRAPRFMPAVFAAVLGGHFLPYSWLFGTPVYVVLGALVSLLPFLVMFALQDRGYPYSFAVFGVCLLVSSWLVF